MCVICATPHYLTSLAIVIRCLVHRLVPHLVLMCMYPVAKKHERKVVSVDKKLEIIML